MATGGVLLDGVHVPLTVPFYTDGESYLRKLEHNVRRYCLGPIAGLVALSPGSEAEGLSDEEQKATLRAVGETASAEKVLIAGVRRESVRGSVMLAQEADRAGFDAVLLAAPRQWPGLRGGQERTGELAAFFQAVADQSPLPVVLWSEARLPEAQLTVELLRMLAEHPNVLGLYDADLDTERVASLRALTTAASRTVTVTPVFAPVTRRMLAPKAADTGAAGNFVSADQLAGGSVSLAAAPPVPALRTRTRLVGFQVMAAGAANGMTRLLGEGIPGVAPAFSACAPQACHEVYAAFKDGNPSLAAEKEERLREADRLLAELGPAGLKFACDLNGFAGGRARLPRLPLTGAERASVERAMFVVRQ